MALARKSLQTRQLWMCVCGSSTRTISTSSSKNSATTKKNITSYNPASKTKINTLSFLKELDDRTNTGESDHHREYSSGSILVKTNNGVRTVTLNKPQSYNALTMSMYKDIITILSEAEKDDSVSTILFTGNGKFFSSGNDLRNFADFEMLNAQMKAEGSVKLIKQFVSALIDFPKPLIAAVNGPAFGISVAILGLFDAVYATDKATFQTPFVSLGETPIGCSSYTFPKLMGHAKACSLLLFGHTFSCPEAQRYGLITKMFPESTFRDEVDKEVEKYQKSSFGFMKRYTLDGDRELLHRANDQEMKRLSERILSEDSLNAVEKLISTSR